jgi:uncharacterized protein
LRFALAFAVAAAGVSGCGKVESNAVASDSTWCRQSYPALSSHVVDQAGLLAPTQEAALNQQLIKLEARTKHQMVVATVPSLEGKPVAEYSICLARHWGIGRKDMNDGVMLLVAPNEQRVRIEVGYGLEKALSDPEAQNIVDRSIVPAFKRGDFAGGISAGVDAIIAQIGVVSQ